jgi:hypothetical protein
MRNLPHRNFIPVLRNDGLEWVATLGTDPVSSIVGRGETPMGALMDFDKKWYGAE